MNGRRERGITLVELIVILGIAGVVVLLLGPALQSARAAARRASCIANLRAIGLALHNYVSTNEVYPPSDVRGQGRGIGAGFLLRLTPFLEETRVYNAYNFDLEPWDETNATAVTNRLDVSLCPDNPRADNIPASDLKVQGTAPNLSFGPAHYAANWGGGRDRWGRDFAEGQGTYLGVMMTIITADGEVKAPDGKPRARCIGLRDLLDGTVNTLAVAEKEESLGWAVGGFAASEFEINTKPKNDEGSTIARRVYTGSPHREGIHVAMCDGSVRRIGPGMDRTTWYALMTRARGEALPSDPPSLSAPLTPDRDRTAESRDRPQLAVKSAEEFVKRLLAKPAGDVGAIGPNSQSVSVVDLQTGEAGRIIAPLAKNMDSCRFPAWSADGRHIVFCASQHERRDEGHIYALDLEETGIQLRDLGPGLAPSPSPSGDRILFQISPGSSEESGVWLMRADGQGRRRLGGDGRPRWSPDGHQFLIYRWQDNTITLIDDRPGRSSGEIRLEGRTMHSMPSWTESEIFVATLGDATTGSNADCIALVQAPAADRASIKSVLWKNEANLAIPYSPVLNAETGRCVFVGVDAAGSGLYILDPAKGQAPSRLQKAGQVLAGMTPSMSPDGRYVIYANNDTR